MWVVEMDRSGRCQAYEKTEAELIELAKKGGFVFDELTLDEAEDLGNEAAINVAKTYGKVLDVNNGHETVFYSPSEAPTELDSAIDYLGHDLQKIWTIAADDVPSFLGSNSTCEKMRHALEAAIL